MSVQIDGSTGNIIATKADYSGDVSIGGTLTYEDVTNIDSVGLITARNGIKVDDLGVQVGTGATVDSAGDNILTFLTNGNERIRVTSAGRVGIGTDSPARELVVHNDSADAHISIRSVDSQQAMILFGDNASDSIGQIRYDNTDNSLAFRVNVDERLRITSSGNTGIGTDNPGSRLHVDSGTDAVVGKFVSSNTSAAVLELDSLASNYTELKLKKNGTVYGNLQVAFNDLHLVQQQNANLKFYTNNTERLRIHADGEVEIKGGNAAAGQTPLSVEGNYTSSGNVDIQTWARTGGAVKAAMRYVDADTLLKFGTTTNHGFGFITNATERLRIDSGGNVNIKGGNLSVGLDSATVDFTDSNSNTKFVEIGASGGDALLVTHSSGAGVGYFGYEVGGDRLVVACDNGSGSNKIDFIVNAGTTTGGGTNNLNNVSPTLRITSGGDLLLGGQTAYTYDDTGASNTILDIANSTNNKRGILSLSGNSNANGPSIGTIWFNNDQNSGTGPGATMKLVAAIQAKAVTSDSNAGDDSGAYLQFLTKPESAALAESMVIHSDGEVIKSKQPGFFTRRAVGGDGRSGGAQEWSVNGTGSFNTGSHFNASNGRFTAPIAGKYLFTAAPGYKQSGQNFNFYFRINGGDASEGCRFVDGGDDLVSHSTGTATVIYNLSANDYVDVYVGQTHHVNLTYNFFMGYLLG